MSADVSAADTLEKKKAYVTSVGQKLIPPIGSD
jgi:hypothetical protein